jgi:spermidine/putrescine transport system substrate-binding protein
MLKSKNTFSRSAIIMSGSIASLAAMASPARVTNALAASGKMTLMDWSGYWPEDMLAKFTSETGIKANYIGIGSNEEPINKMKASNGAGAYLSGPTNNRSLQWGPLELLQTARFSQQVARC